MKAMDLLRALGEIPDRYVQEAEAVPVAIRRRRWRRLSAVAACLLLVAGACWILPQLGGRSSGPDTMDAPRHYAAPLLPLTLEEEGEVSAQREVILDLSQMGQRREDGYSASSAAYTDRYTLHNDTEKEQLLTLLYPFCADLWDMMEPEFAVNGESVTAERLIGGYSGNFTPQGEEYNLYPLDSAQGYWELLQDEDYLRSVGDEAKISQEPVTVYRFTDFEGADEDAENPTFAVEFTMNSDKTMLLSYGFNGGRFVEGEGRAQRHASLRKGMGDCYLIAVGEDVADLAMAGYPDGACEQGREMEGISARMIREEKPLAQVLGEISRAYYEEVMQADPPLRMVTSQVFEEEVLRFFSLYSPLGGEAKPRYDLGMLEDILSETLRVDRVCFLKWEVRIPAGETLTVEARGRLEASFYYDTSSRDQEYSLEILRTGSALPITQTGIHKKGTEGFLLEEETEDAQVHRLTVKEIAE